MKCPKCKSELRRSKKDPSYGLCDNCRKKFRWVDSSSKYLHKKSNFSTQLSNKSCKTKRRYQTAAIISIAFIVILLIGIMSDDGKSDKSTDKQTENSNTEKTQTLETITPNTSSAVDAIAREAKKSANSSASEEKRNEALQYIVDNYPDYFSDNETMEKTMYYGYYLEYAYAQNGSDNLYANLGIDTYQVVKYVYRNAEEISSDHVQSNLKQIKNTLSQLGYDIS